MPNIILTEPKQREVQTILMSFPISELDRVQALIKILNESIEVATPPKVEPE
jgi:hypothetical protein